MSTIAKSLIIASVVDSKEYRCVCIFFIPNTFTYTTIGNKKVIIKIKVKQAELLKKIDP